MMQQGAKEYFEFLQKFKVKKTTDDCYTPVAVYEAVRDWAVTEYGLHGRRIVRPFIPEGDYQAIDYQVGDVVIDNPPFSIITQIRKWYDLHGVDYFLFGPALTLFSSDAPCSIVVNEMVEYANGAKVQTGFITNIDPCKVRTAPTLKAAIREAVASSKPSTPPKYDYPRNVISAARLGKISSVDFKVPRECATGKISTLDSQREVGKRIFGDGVIISDKKAAELKAAELKAAELKAAELKAEREVIEWVLSDREKEIIANL